MYGPWTPVPAAPELEETGSDVSGFRLQSGEQLQHSLGTVASAGETSSRRACHRLGQVREAGSKALSWDNGKERIPGWGRLRPQRGLSGVRVEIPMPGRAFMQVGSADPRHDGEPALGKQCLRGVRKCVWKTHLVPQIPILDISWMGPNSAQALCWGWGWRWAQPAGQCNDTEMASGNGEESRKAHGCRSWSPRDVSF